MEVVHELVHLAVAEVLEDVEPLVGEDLRGAEAAAAAPPWVAGGPGEGVKDVGLGGDGGGDGAVGEGLVVLLEDFLGSGGGGGDGDGDGAEAQGHEGAVGFGQVGEGGVGFWAELVEVSDDREAGWTGRLVFAVAAV